MSGAYSTGSELLKNAELSCRFWFNRVGFSI